MSAQRVREACFPFKIESEISSFVSWFIRLSAQMKFWIPWHKSKDCLNTNLQMRKIFLNHKVPFMKRRLGEPSGPKRAKRARANSQRESRVREAGGHQLVWVRASFTLRCRPPTQLVVGSEVRGYDSPKSIVSEKWKWKWKSESEQILGLVFLWNFYML